MKISIKSLPVRRYDIHTHNIIPLYGTSHVKFLWLLSQNRHLKKFLLAKWKHKCIKCDRIITKTNKLNHEKTELRNFENLYQINRKNGLYIKIKSR
jgi:hypothetical protein